jgi:hypothetical protein
MLSALERRRTRPITAEEAQDFVFNWHTSSEEASVGPRIHADDPAFRTNLDAAHALALACIETEAGGNRINVAKAFALKHGINPRGQVARLICALLEATSAYRKECLSSNYRELQAWEDVAGPLFGFMHITSDAPYWNNRRSGGDRIKSDKTFQENGHVPQAFKR